MKYSLNPFKWLKYIYQRVKYRKTRWRKFFCDVPYSKEYEQGLKMRLSKLLKVRRFRI